MWYCAHAIFYFKEKYTIQESFLIYENVYFFDAENPEAAYEKVEKFAKENEDLSENDTLEIDGKKAMYLYAGIRKLTEVDTIPDSKNSSLCLLNGLELTYSVFEADKMEELQALVDGKKTNLLYRDG